MSEDNNHILELLAQGPLRIAAVTNNVPAAQLNQRSDEEPWSVSDILAHLRACSDLWGASMIDMITQENPTRRYVSPRSLLKKPKYADQAFAAALALFIQERHKLIAMLADLDEAGWLRSGTFTGTSPRQREQTVMDYARRMVNHEQPHLSQIEALVRPA